MVKCILAQKYNACANFCSSRTSLTVALPFLTSKNAQASKPIEANTLKEIINFFNQLIGQPMYQLDRSSVRILDTYLIGNVSNKLIALPK